MQIINIFRNLVSFLFSGLLSSGLTSLLVHRFSVQLFDLQLVLLVQATLSHLCPIDKGDVAQFC